MQLKHDTRKAPEIERAASSDESRPVLCHAYLNVEDGTLEATDSYMAVIVPVEIEDGDTSGPIPRDALKAQRKASKRYPASLSVNGDVALRDTYEGTEQTWKRPDVGQWPNLRKITPDDLSGFRIGLNAAKLLDLAKALGSDGEVTLEFRRQRNTYEEGEAVGYFPDRLGPMKVTVPSGGDSWGILMPLRVP